MIFFFKQKTAYEIKECDWSSDVCSSDLSPSVDREWVILFHYFHTPSFRSASVNAGDASDPCASQLDSAELLDHQDEGNTALTGEPGHRPIAPDFITRASKSQENGSQKGRLSTGMPRAPFSGESLTLLSYASVSDTFDSPAGKLCSSALRRAERDRLPWPHGQLRQSVAATIIRGNCLLDFSPVVPPGGS